jgi:hypothetical protein
MATVQLKDRCGIYGDFDDRDIIMVHAWQKAWRDGLAASINISELDAEQRKQPGIHAPRE